MTPPPPALLYPPFDVTDIPDRPGVFVIWPSGAGAPYAAKTAVLRRRLRRLLAPPLPGQSRGNVSAVASRVDFWLTGSQLETALVHYAVSKQLYPDDYLRRVRLHSPAFLRLRMTHEFPRVHTTSRLAPGGDLYYGPFRTRASAEQFEAEVLSLFQIRRCVEDWRPAPDHPGCIYGEMNLCLRPCQQLVSVEEYRSEAERVKQLLATDGRLQMETLTAARDRASESLDFEQAARLHERLEKLVRALEARDGLATDIDQLCGLSLGRTPDPHVIRIWRMQSGVWQQPADYDTRAAGHGASVDGRLRELLAGPPAAVPARDREEHIALLAKWYYSSWRQDPWLSFRAADGVPYRKLVRLLSKFVTSSGGGSAAPPGTSM